MAISIAKAKALCNASELALVKASSRQQIKSLTPAKLRDKVSRSRKLRDKWRDQAERQRREVQTKQGARQTSASARSAEKASLFAEVLGRFEKQLANAEDVPREKSRVKKKSATAGEPKRLKRSDRSKLHRADRAVVRETLDQARLEMDEGRKKKRAGKTTAKNSSPAAKVKPAPSAAKMSESAETETRETVVSKPSKKRNRPAPPAASGPISKLAAAQGLRMTKGLQQKVQAVAKKNRIKVSGSKNIQKHMSAQNKRKQARRDSR